MTHATFPQNGPDDRAPCHTAITLANGYKAAGVTIYSIGYDLGNTNCTGSGFHKKKSGGGYTACTAGTSGCYHHRDAITESPTITSYTTLTQIASPGKFYNAPSGVN